MVITESMSDSVIFRDLSMITEKEEVSAVECENMRGFTNELLPVNLHKVVEHSERNGLSSITWGEFLHVPNKKCDNFKSIQEEKINDTKKLLGGNKGASSEPLR